MTAKGGYQGCNATHSGCKANRSGFHRCGDTARHSGSHSCRYEGCRGTWS